MKIEMKILNNKFYKKYDTESYYPCKHYQEGFRCDYCEKIVRRKIPSYATAGSCGIDLICCEDTTIIAASSVPIHTGIAIWLGSSKKDVPFFDVMSFFTVGALILPRSSLGLAGLDITNTIGLIDEDYQGELIVHVYTRSGYPDIHLKAGDKFAQLCCIPVITAELQIVENFTRETARGKGGFGSTNLKS